MSTQLTEGNIPEFDTADRMRKTLRSSGVGVSEIAEYLGVGRNTVSNWINGRNPASVQTLRLWALRTGVPFEWLATGESPRPEGPEGDDGEGLPRVDSNHQPAGYTSAQVIELRTAPWLQNVA